ncbi:cyclin-dependent kinase-like 2 [Rhopilema esculentum]|uniref:cyclin-dependent kinase-like 2 n=1 Tax=Rhopilema esculentum TaxID=499914 RepID=UPI0031D6C411
MERYENLGLVGEGSYGMVMKCRHKETNQLVAIKKFIESEDDKMVKKIAMREIRMLKQLHHSNLVNLLEVFRRKKRLFLVFEYVDRTVLDDLDKAPNGLDETAVKKISYQVLRGLDFCHTHNIIHRDVKPENILVSKSGIVKLCDFGFARPLAIGPGEVYTDYVATRWYRAPELLVGDTNYGKAVDIWAVGCLLSEMLTGEPLFPGDSDIDQLFHITKCLGNLTPRHQEIFSRNPLFMGMRVPEVKETEPLEKKYPRILHDAMNIIKKSLELDGNHRPSCQQMMKHDFYTRDQFAEKFLVELKNRVEKDNAENPLLRALANRRESAEEKVKREREKEKERERERERERREKKNKKELDLKKKRDISMKASNPSLSKSSSSPDAKIAHVSTSSENFHHQKNAMHYGNIQLSPIHDSEHHKENTEDGMALNRSDTKMSSRTTLGLNISAPGADLPQASSQGHRGLDPKLKKVSSIGHTKKQASDFNGHLTSERMTHQDQRTNAIDHDKYSRNTGDESTFSDKYKKKNMRQETKDYLIRDSRTDVELPPVSGVTFPSVKGAEGKHHTKTYSKQNKKTYFSTMPHISNIDPFQSGFNINSRESPTDGRSTNHRDRDSKDVRNFPAV